MTSTKIGNLERLAFNICNTSYDITSEYIGKVAAKASERTYDVGSEKRASEKWTYISRSLSEAKTHMDNAWRICKDRMDGECSRHPKIILGYNGTIDDLATDTINLSKYEFRNLTHYIGKELLRQSNADDERERKLLASYLKSAANSMLEASNLI